MHTLPAPSARPMRLVATFATILALALSPSLSLAQSDRADTSFALARNALVDITVRRGVLVIRGSDRTEASLRSTGGLFTMRATGSGMTLGPRQLAGRSFTRDTDEPRVELTVPRGVRVVISAGSADVEVRDIEGDVEVRSNNGDITLERLGARAVVETLSGDILIQDGVGDVRITTANGDVIADGVRGEAIVETTSGDVSIRGTRMPRVRFESISGDVEIEGSLATDARVQVSTHSGDVTLRLAEGTGGMLEFDTHTGELQTSRSLTTAGTAQNRAGKPAGQRYEFGGGGSVLVTISTFNGDVRFERGAIRSSDR